MGGFLRTSWFVARAGEHMSGRPTSVPAFREEATDQGLDRLEL
jgi:hypothetical protein